MHGAAKFLLHDMRDHIDSQRSGHDQEPRPVLDSVAAPEHDQPDWHLHLDSRRKQLEAALQLLKETEQVVLRARFGLADDTDYTLAVYRAGIEFVFGAGAPNTM